MKTLFDKKYWYRWVLVPCYVLVFASFVYSIYYSMPANDDFAWAVDWWSGNRLIEMFKRIDWNYNYYFGNSGIFAIAVQILFNPLYLFNNSGHSFGICMIIANTIIMVGILWSVRTIFKYLFKIEDVRTCDILTFIVALLLTTSYYYSDVYNWWSGTPGYSGMMMMWLVTTASILRFLEDKDNKKSYIAMIILGMITCTSMMYCVAVGAVYVLLVIVMDYKNGGAWLKKFLPLGFYVLAGVLMVIAPGNGARMTSEAKRGYDMVDAIFVTGHRIILRMIMTVQTKPWVLVLFSIIFILGLYAGSKRKLNIFVIIFGYACIVVSAFSGLLLYVYGSAKTIDSEFTPRVYYVEDYLMFIGSAIAVYAFAAWLTQLGGKGAEAQANSGQDQEVVGSGKLRGGVAVAISLFAILIGGLYTLRSGSYNVIMQYDIYQKSALIKESWEFWDDILDEVIAAGPGSDVVIDRDNVDWCQYSYYVSMDEIPKEPLSEDAKYGNCNQCASKYYGVRSIIVNLH